MQSISLVEHDRSIVAETLGEEPAKIFEFHLGLLSDPDFNRPNKKAY